MKFATPFLFLTSLALGFNAAAADETPAPVEITFAYDQGSLACIGKESTYKGTWTSTATNPQLVINCGANNMLTADYSGQAPVIYGGQSGSCTVQMNPSEGWRVSAYKFDALQYSGDKQAMTLTYNGKTLTTTETAQHVEVTLPAGTEPSLVISSANKPVQFDNFVITLVPDVEEDAATLAVDPFPAADAAFPYIVTDIVGNDHFNCFTAWYHLQNDKTYLTGTTLADGGEEGNYDDASLFCFVKSGNSYVLYNKEGGISTPVQGVVIAGEKVTLGSTELTVSFAQRFLPVDVELGTTSRGDGNATNKWRGLWTATAYEPIVKFSGSQNNMTTTDSGNNLVETGDFQLETGSNGKAGNFSWTFAGADEKLYVSGFSFLAKKSGSYSEASTITAGGITTAMNNFFKRIETADIDETASSSFVQNGFNGKGVIMSDAYVTVRRMLKNHGVNVFPRGAIERRIPAIATVGAGENAGRLIAIYDYRHNGGDIGFTGNISLEMSVSDDNGETWSEPAYCKDGNGNAVTTYPEEYAVSNIPLSVQNKEGNKYWNMAFGDAAIVADRESGKVLLMAVGGPVMFFNSRYDNPMQSVSWHSEDGGDTWTPAQRMTSKIYDLFNGEPAFGKIDGMFIGSGRIMQSRYVKVGDYYRIYAVLSSQNNGGNTRNWIIYSDDFGMNWAVLGGTAVCPVPSNGDEPKAEELPDGSVLLAARGKGGNRNFNIFRYTDVEKGEGRWDSFINTNMGFGGINACDGEIMILPVKDNTTGEQTYLALQSFPFGGSRNNVSIAYKPLNTAADIATPSAFTTWEGRYQVTARPSAYSTMTWQKNNTLGFFFEEDRGTGAYSGVYVNLTIEEITGGRYSYQVDENDAAANKLRKEMVEQRAAALTSFEKHGYVGELADDSFLTDAVAAFNAAPSYDAYVAFNKAEYSATPEVVPVLSGGVYRFISAHNGHYAAYTEPRYLTNDGTSLLTTTDATDEATKFVIEKTDEGHWTIYSSDSERYIDNPRAETNQALLMAEAPAAFDFESNLDGRTSVVGVNPGNNAYPAIHMAGNAGVVIWTKAAEASKWYIELLKAPEQDSISEINKAEVEKAGAYYDLTGRRVVRPSRGLFISDNGKKQIF